MAFMLRLEWFHDDDEDIDAAAAADDDDDDANDVVWLQELKGNIRVFARVRPPSNSEMTGAEGGSGTLATEFPNSGEHNTHILTLLTVKLSRR
jgi:hypothetical protein